MNEQQPPQKKKGCGCIAKGCVVMLIIGVALIGVLVWETQRLISEFHSHSSTASAAVQADAGTQDEYDALVKRLDDFKSGGKKLELTGHDINLLIAFSPEWSGVRGRIRASIDKDVIALNGSLPLDFVRLSGEYLNGEARFTLSRDDKGIHSSILGIRVKDAELPDADVNNFSGYWSAYMHSGLLPVLGPVFMKAKTLKVSDGVIVLTSE